MAVEGPLLAGTRRLLEELGDRVLELPRFPLPVRLWRDDRCSALRLDLMVGLEEKERGEQEVSLGELSNHGLRISGWYGSTAYGSAEVGSLGRVVDTRTEAFVEAAPIVRPTLDRSVPEAWNRWPGATAPAGGGEGVVVGIVDSGIDLTHPSFRTASGETRVLYLWDQAAEDMTGVPLGFPSGREWGKTEIDRQLDATGLPAVWTDPVGHGTKVAGVAAGNGRGNTSGRYLGMAPEADLIVVALEAKREAFASTNNALEGIRYVFERARDLGKRAVVNLSQGVQLGAHQPADLTEIALTGMLSEDEHRIVVVSAGNTGDAGAHSRLTLLDGESLDLTLIVPPRVGPAVLVDLWYDAADGLDIEIVDPAGSSSSTVKDREGHRGLISGDVFSIEYVPNRGRTRANNLLVELRSTNLSGDVQDGSWTLRLRGRSMISGAPVDAWLDCGPLSWPRFDPAHVEADYTVTSPATATGALAVGAYAMSPAVGPISSLSGRGPDRVDADLEMLAAPGCPVVTTDSTYTGAGEFAVGYGTSLAAAHVSGAVALMLEAAPSLTRDQAIQCLCGTARRDGDISAGPASAWGAGKLDVEAALACVSKQANREGGSDVGEGDRH